jgi:hypothetical protein
VPCCTFEKRPEAFHPVGIFFVCGTILIAAAPPILLLAALAAALPPLRPLSRRSWSLLRVVREVVNTDFLHPRHRCAMSARLMDRSPRLAGLVYRNLNLAALLGLWGAVFTAAAGTAVAIGI